MKYTFLADEIQFIRISDVLVITGLSRASIYNGIKKGSFPAQIKLGPKSARWVKSEVLEWAEAMVRNSRQATDKGALASLPEK
jgi:prophage regulatory protein